MYATKYINHELK